jgi:hypothetical protein
MVRCLQPASERLSVSPYRSSRPNGKIRGEEIAAVPCTPQRVTGRPKNDEVFVEKSRIDAAATAKRARLHDEYRQYCHVDTPVGRERLHSDAPELLAETLVRLIRRLREIRPSTDEVRSVEERCLAVLFGVAPNLPENSAGRRFIDRVQRGAAQLRGSANEWQDVYQTAVQLVLEKVAGDEEEWETMFFSRLEDRIKDILDSMNRRSGGEGKERRKRRQREEAARSEEEQRRRDERRRHRNDVIERCDTPLPIPPRRIVELTDASLVDDVGLLGWLQQSELEAVVSAILPTVPAELQEVARLIMDPERTWLVREMAEELGISRQKVRARRIALAREFVKHPSIQAIIEDLNFDVSTIGESMGTRDGKP